MEVDGVLIETVHGRQFPVAVGGGAAAAVGVGLIAAGRHRRGQPLPFGPFLAVGAVVALVLSKVR